jgi:hypothetical protein
MIMIALTGIARADVARDAMGSGMDLFDKLFRMTPQYVFPCRGVRGILTAQITIPKLLLGIPGGVRVHTCVHLSNLYDLS